MLTLIVGGEENFNEETQRFESHGGFELELEHSLVTLSKWESIHQIPFLGPEPKTERQLMDYVQCMILSPNPPEDAVERLGREDFDKIHAYLESKESATTFGKMPERRGPGEIITSELIYYWMVAFNIPFECETWHLNRLFALIRICNIKNSPQKKMSRSEMVQRNRELNEQRRAQLGTRG